MFKSVRVNLYENSVEEVVDLLLSTKKANLSMAPFFSTYFVRFDGWFPLPVIEHLNV